MTERGRGKGSKGARTGHVGGAALAKRGRRPVSDPGSDEEAAARDYGRQRTVYAQGNSWVIAIPLWARRRLGCVRGGMLYWHDTRSDEVVLAVGARRIGGRPIGQALQHEVDRLRRENRRFRRRLGAGPMAQLAEEVRELMIQAVRVGLPMTATIDETRDMVREVLARIPWRGARPGRRVVIAAAPVLDAEPSPVADALASGEQAAGAVAVSAT